MTANQRAQYLRLALQEEHAARNSTSADARERHEELAILYEMRCLLDTPPKVAESVKGIEPAV
jgi:hypothetical protein